jgi:uncharacterized membrane protein
MNAIVLLVNQQINNTVGYAIGVGIALLIFGFLLYTLVKPEKF